jgi:hypothetical protein
MLKASAGTSTGQLISCAAPAASVTSCGAKFSGVRTISAPLPLFAVPASVARTFIVRAVVLRSVSMAAKRSPSRTSGGRPASTCRSCVTRILVLPLPKRCTAFVGHRDEAEARQRIVQRHLDQRLAVGVEHDARVPQQQRVEQLARSAAPAAPATCGHRLAAVVAPADDLALRGGRLHAPGALLDHRVQQVPRFVAAQREQALVDRREGDLGAGQRLALVASP